MRFWCRNDSTGMKIFLRAPQGAGGEDLVRASLLGGPFAKAPSVYPPPICLAALGRPCLAQPLATPHWAWAQQMSWHAQTILFILAYFRGECNCVPTEKAAMLVILTQHCGFVIILSLFCRVTGPTPRVGALPAVGRRGATAGGAAFRHSEMPDTKLFINRTQHRARG